MIGDELLMAYWAQNQNVVPPDNEVWYYATEQVKLYSSTGVVSHTFANGKGVLTFASAVTTVGQWLKGTAITDVGFPVTVTSLGGSAFSGCTNLALTSLPSGVTSIGEYAFRNCTNLALTSLPSGVTRIRFGAFSDCTNLALTSLPSGVTSIEGSAFSSCKNLALTSLPSGVTSIGLGAFYDCKNLTEMHLGSAITSIGANAYALCYNLLNLYCDWAEGAVANAPWGAPRATIHYNS